MKPIQLDKFDPNPYQPETRRDIPPDEVAALAQSIVEVGLIHVPVVREGKDGRYQVADGWRRLAAYRHLAKTDHKYNLMPAEVRELTDRQMADTVLHSAHFRKDLTPIEQAQAFEKYLEEFKCTQGELAKRSGLSQGELANTIRLLLLPAELQYLVASGTLPQTHARHFLRLNALPKMQKELLQDFLKDGMSVNLLDRQVHNRIWQNSKSLNPKADSWERPAFDVTSCKGCEFMVQATEPYGNRKSEQRCVKDECWKKKNEEAVAKLAKEMQEKVKKELGGKKLLTSKDLQHNEYQHLESYTMKDMDNPKECSGCEHVAMFKYRIEDTVALERVCLKPSCYRSKKAKKTRDENKVKAVEDKQLTAQLVPTLQHAHASPRNAVLVIARHIIPRLSAAAKIDLLAAFPDLPRQKNHILDIEKLTVDLEGKSLDDLLALTVSTIICDGRRASASYDRFSTKLSADLQLDISTLDGTLEKHRAKITVWQEANCRGCSNANQVLIGTGRECCQHTYNKKILSDGNCERGKAHQAQTESKQAPVARVEGTEATEPTSNTPSSERRTVLGKTEDGKFFIREDDIPVGIPEGVRLAHLVPDSECQNCNLAATDHTFDFKFPAPSKSASNGVVYQKVCIKDYRAWEHKQGVPADQRAKQLDDETTSTPAEITELPRSETKPPENETTTADNETKTPKIETPATLTHPHKNVAPKKVKMTSKKSSLSPDKSNGSGKLKNENKTRKV